MRTKHAVLLVPVFLAGAVALVPPGRAEDAGRPGGLPGEAEAPAFDEVTPESEEALAKGLAWLATNQQQAGCWSPGAYPVAVTSLATLALMADGNVPGRGRYAEPVSKGLRYLLERAGRTGYITELDGRSRMHGHGFATLALVEAFGMMHNPLDLDVGDMALKIRNAIQIIEKAQTKDGGWGYSTDPTQPDEASVTICCVQALRAARNAGFKVDKKVVEGGIKYIKRCKTRDGSFRYSIGMGSANTSFALTAGAVASLAFLGEYDCDEYRAGVEYMMRFKPPRARDGGHYFYESFYASLAMYYAGGTKWAEWYPPIRDEIARGQDKATGSWKREISEEYCTALACLILEVPHRYLPIYQR